MDRLCEGGVARKRKAGAHTKRFPTKVRVCQLTDMAHDQTANEPTDSASEGDFSPPAQSGWTISKQIDFLRMLAETQCVTTAARSVGMGRQSAYKLRARLADAPFGAGWRLATKSARSALLEAAYDRAINGVEVPHYWQGQLVGVSRRYDERLTGLLLKPGATESAGHDVRHGIEAEYANTGLERLLGRIEDGPAQWCDFQEERHYAWGEDAFAEDAGYDDYGPEADAP